jgi:phage-related baseplate assembly protein
MTFDINSLPDVQFADLDTATVQSAIITYYEGLTLSVLYPGDPVRLFLSTLAAVIAQRNVLLDFTGKMNLLRYATGAYLDQIAAMYDVQRLQPSFAGAIERFSVAAPQLADQPIPQGTRVTADGLIYFATKALATLPAGLLYVDIPIEATTAGAAANGLVAGQISRLVDPLPFVVNVANTIATSGGADTEQDDPFRARIQLSPESFSVAGPELAYVFWAESANPDITDVSVWSPSDGVVNVAILTSAGIPDPASEEIQDVTAALSAKNRRPLTDKVTVMPAVAFAADFTVTWFITTDQAPYEATIATNVAAAVASYIAWQTASIGLDLIPGKLTQLCLEAGAKRITTTGLVYTVVGQDSVVQFAVNNNRIIFGGIEAP